MPSPVTSRIGVISDTHGLLRPEAVAALEGSDRIFHAGDVGDPEILDTLREIAPLSVIRGNVDHGPWARELPETLEAPLAVDAAAFLIHDAKELPGRGIDPAEAGYRVVVSGHSHRPSVETRDGVLYLNPGSAGPRRFTLPVTVAYLVASTGDDGAVEVTAEIVELSV